jgi:predicted ribosomally synthesized peptide with nif11-like leader
MKIKEFVAKIKANDKDLVAKLGKCKSPDEAYKVAKAAGLDATKDEFVAEMKKLNEAVKELDEKSLDKVAGGRMSDGEIASTVIGSVGAVAGIVSAAAAAAV